MPILFYKTREAYGGFSNFSRHPVNIYDQAWPTSEHAFQAQKFHPHRPDLVEAVRHAGGPSEAASMGRNREFPLAGGWDKPLDSEALAARIPDHVALETEDKSQATDPLFAFLKDVVMYEVVYAKLVQHQDLKDLLLGTGTERIIEATAIDPYWGWGSTTKGVNKLGRIFMAIRASLRQSANLGVVFGKPSCVAV
jgi:predicted NAD-dependent protein-ADP-ribosyltransferase YbiA (DUF1768 family)